MNNLLNFNNSFFSKSSPPPSSLSFNHAQNFSVSKLQQHKDRENAQVSINRYLNKNVSQPTSSVFRIGQDNSRPISSINRLGQQNQNDDYESQEEMDERRYNYIRRLIRKRKAKEKEEALKEAINSNNQSDRYSLGLKTGGGFRTKGKLSLKRKLLKLRKKDPLTYKNLSKRDMDYLQNVIKSHAKAVSRGVGFNRISRKQMKMKIERDRRKGIISKADSIDMKNIIDNLPH